MVYHCENNYDTKVLLDRVNAIWTPQANIVFALASSTPAPIVDEVRISQALGGWGRTLPKIVEFNDFEDMFKDVKVNENPKADFTIFMVNGLTHGGAAVRGITNTNYGFALVSDSGRAGDSRTMAHEIGHYFGTLGKGGVLYDEFYGNNQEDLLMGAGGDGTKVPFADVIKYFNTNYK